MSSRLRKLAGTVLLVTMVPAYALLAMLVAVAILPGVSVWLQLGYYVVAGLVWVLPAGLLIKWMVRLDR